MGTFILHDNYFTSPLIYGHQGMAYGAVHGLFFDPETGKEIVRGWYAAYPETTYCLKEDYERNPPRLIEGVVCWEMTDWGLPNRMGFRQVTAPHKIEIIPPNTNRQEVK